MPSGSSIRSGTGDRPLGPLASGEKRTKWSVPGLSVLVRVAPFAVFIAFLAAQPLLERWFDPKWIVVARGLLVGALLLVFWPAYSELKLERRAGRARDAVVGILAGAAIFLAWLVFDSGWAFFGKPGAGFVPLTPDGRLDFWAATLRLLGFALVVPIMEELFWRSFFMRWIEKREFLTADPAATGILALSLSSALFALEHSQWFAGLMAGLSYGWLYLRSRDLWIPIIGHTTTNALLGSWILYTSSWHYW